MGIEAALITMAVVGTAASIQQQQQARKEQKKARAESEAMNAERANAERRQQIREERIRRAQVEQAAVNTGTQGSSGEMGAMGNLSSTLASNIGFNFSQVAHANAISAFNQSAVDKAGRGQLYGQLGSLALTGASIFGGAAAKQPTPLAESSPNFVGPSSAFRNQ